MRKKLLFAALALMALTMQAQVEAEVSETVELMSILARTAGNREYNKQNYTEAEVNYRRGLEKNKNGYEAHYNLGDALFKQDKYADAQAEFETAAKMLDKKEDKTRYAKAMHNIGNCHFAQQHSFDLFLFRKSDHGAFVGTVKDEWIRMSAEHLTLFKQCPVKQVGDDLIIGSPGGKLYPADIRMAGTSDVQVEKAQPELLCKLFV
jgi:tetratricopeptide (TPR) repeat protein